MAFWNRKKKPLEDRFAEALSEVCARDLHAKPELNGRSMRVVGIWSNEYDGTAEIQIRLGPNREAVQRSVERAVRDARAAQIRDHDERVAISVSS